MNERSPVSTAAGAGAVVRRVPSHSYRPVRRGIYSRAGAPRLKPRPTRDPFDGFAQEYSTAWGGYQVREDLGFRFRHGAGPNWRPNRKRNPRSSVEAHSQIRG